MDIKERYEELYVEHIINGDGTATPEMRELFKKILNDEFHDDHNKMDALIESIIDRNTIKEPTEIEKLQLENAELKQSALMNEATILELADMMLSR